MASSFVLDSYAILALLGGETGAEEVALILSALESGLAVSAVNVGEVFYILRRRRGLEAAVSAEEAIYGHPRLKVAEASRERIRAAALLKADGGLSFADAFALALAKELGGTLVTGDPEFAKWERDGQSIRWISRAEAR